MALPPPSGDLEHEILGVDYTRSSEFQRILPE